jgi:hypothetical protein
VSQYKFLLIDEWGGGIRKFASKLEATPYLTDGMKLVKLPKQPSAYEVAVLTMKESPW